MNLNQHKTIIDLVKLNELNAEGCPACGRKLPGLREKI
jgi:hypothetical protein